MATLILYPLNGTRGIPFPLYRRITTIGSGEETDIRIQDPTIGSLHAQVMFTSENFEISLMDRKAQIFVNGKKVKRERLEDLDIIRIGRRSLQFTLLDPPPDEEATGTGEDDLWFRRLNEFTEAVMDESSIDKLVEKLLDKLIEVTRADRGFLFLVRDGEPFLHARRNIDGVEGDRDGLFSDSIVRRVLESREPLLISDALHDDKFGSARSVMNYKLCSVMCIPLMTRSKLVGIIYLGNDNIVNLFTRQSLDVAGVFASQAALLIQNALLINELSIERKSLQDELEQIRFGEIIGASESMRKLYRKIERVAATDIGVLIAGDTGVGKELVARELHKRSPRAKEAFIAINCGAIPENLIESELFGHMRGAFTGAYATKKGCFQAAHQGSLFLDEIGELPLILQAKLLRALEARQVTKVGATTPEDVDIRVIAATNRNLEAEVAAGRFREDLYYRLNVVVLDIPPLRDRGGDIELIARYLLRKFARQYNLENARFGGDAVAAMQAYTWPGNVREMENRIRKGLVLCENGLVSARDLDLLEEEILSLNDAKEAFQRDYILSTLSRNQGNRTKTARQLGVDPRTIFRYLEKERDEV